MSVRVEGEVYAHVARGLLFDGRSLTLVDLAPSTIWSSPTPSSALGYLPTGDFLDVWTERAQRLGHSGTHRVRGILSLLDPDAQLAGQAILMLRNPHVTASGLTYDIEVLQGMVPAESGACVLFLEWDSGPNRTDGTPSG